MIRLDITPQARLVVLVSGNGSNLQAILDATASGVLQAEVALVVSNVAGVPALERAAAAGVARCVLERRRNEARADYDTRLTAVVADARPDWVVLAGWMRILTMGFLGRFPNHVLNLHPALPGELPGTGAVEQAYAEARKGLRTRTGVMVHLVPDEGVDDGPVLASAEVPIRADDSYADLARRVHDCEHSLLVSTLAGLIYAKDGVHD
ncbi:MAG: phosphoribosylglycinamide formyltransferase [Ilumatobacteraceae bacterium]